jgi:hypothetical protein
MSDQEQAQPGGIPQVDDVAGGLPQEFHPAQPYVPPEELLQSTQVAELSAPVDEEADMLEVDLPPVGEPQAFTSDTADEFNWPAPAPNNNATLEIPYSTPVAEDKWDDLATTLAMPPDTAARWINYAEQQPNPDLGNNEKGEEWVGVITDGLGNGSFQDNMAPAARREGADYRQRIMAGDKILAIASPRIHDDEGPLLTGERGMLRVNALLGRGALIQVPLWHSGFWITLKSPGETQLLDTFQRIIDNKITFGRASNGLAFANHAVYTNAAVVDLAMQCLYETSVQGLSSWSEVRTMIKAPDLHMLAWGLACAVNPRGFQFERSLIDPKGLATTVVRENLNVGALLWTDRNSLDDWQIAHMARRVTGSMTKDQVKLYGDHFVRGTPKSVLFNDDLGMTMRVPSIDEYLITGQLWVDELVAAVNEAFTQETDHKQRNSLILDRAKATSMRQYSHWIESFDLPKLNKKMVDRETLTKTCASLSSDNSIRLKFYETMKAYINDSMVALIGVPQVHPEESGQVKPRFENIIPLDPISVFFSLLSQKIQQIRMRQ